MRIGQRILRITIKNTHMVKTKKPKLSLFIVAAALTVGTVVPYVRADKYDDQINALNQQTNQSQSQLNDLQEVASDYQSAINALAAEINDVQSSINSNVARQADLEQQITDNQVKIDQARQVMGENLKTLYVDGQMSSMEMLATSKNLSDYVDKEEYRTIVQNKVQQALKQVQTLQAEQQKQKAEVEGLIKDQQSQRDDLAAKKSQQASMLAYNQQQQDNYTSQIKANSSKVQQLRAAQAAENARLSNGGGVIGGAPCAAGSGDTYPAKWCSKPMDSVLDNWGMYNRECVSYTAWKVYKSGRYMPYWGGRGNANQWDDNARAAGIPVDSHPRTGDVAIKNSGTYGHSLYVEYAYDDGSILVSDYNQQWDGAYRRYTISASTVAANNLVFIHF